MTFKVSAAVILQYHHVSDSTPSSTSISPVLFEQHMSIVHEQGFAVISLQKLIKLVQNQEKIPDKTLVITFDDGYRNIAVNAAPELEKYGYTYTVFINPESINKKQSDLLTWQQIDDLGLKGAEFANHTNRHDYLLKKPPSESIESWINKIVVDVNSAEATIAKETGKSLKMVAYPYGEFNLRIQNALKNNGYVGIGQHSGAVGNQTILTRVPRFPASGVYANPKTLVTKINSLPFEVLTKNITDPEVIGSKPPTLNLQVKVSDFNQSQFNCFASHGGEVSINWTNDSSVTISTEKVLPVGRSRFNCTAPSLSKKGRYYWFSQPWFNYQTETD